MAICEAGLDLSNLSSSPDTKEMSNGTADEVAAQEQRKAVSLQCQHRDRGPEHRSPKLLERCVTKPSPRVIG